MRFGNAIELLKLHYFIRGVEGTPGDQMPDVMASSHAATTRP
jgi:hypothetical protein